MESVRIEIYFTDLTEAKQQEFLEAGFDPQAPNCDGWPLAIIDVPPSW